MIKYKTELAAFGIYTAVFAAAARLAVYTLPFVIALVISVVMKPLYDYLRRRFAFRSAFAATAITLLVFGALLSAVAFLLYLAAVQAVGFIDRHWDSISEYVSSKELFNNIRDAVMSGDLLGTVSDIASSLLRIVPLMIAFVVITFALTVFFLHHLSDIKDNILSRVGEERKLRTRAVLGTSYTLVRRFIRSYLVLYIITFIEAVFIFYLTGVEYPLAFAFITAIADVLPVLGPGMVYLPTAAVFILQKNYFQGITLAVYFLLTVILRQILEPKLVSDTVKVHPLVVLAAIYFSIASMSIWVFFYVILLFMLFKVLYMSNVIDRGKSAL